MLVSTLLGERIVANDTDDIQKFSITSEGWEECGARLLWRHCRNALHMSLDCTALAVSENYAELIVLHFPFHSMITSH